MARQQTPTRLVGAALERMSVWVTGEMLGIEQLYVKGKDKAVFCGMDSQRFFWAGARDEPSTY